MLCEIVLTVSESKRLIAKGVAAMPAVRDALADGVVAVATGSTNAYIVEELTGKPIEKNAYMTGATLPAGIDRKGLLSRKVPDLVLRKGEPVEGAQATEIVGEMGPGDVFIKGANAVHYQIPQEGELIVWKKLREGICKLRIPPDAKRTGSIVGRKCRCEFAVVLELPKGTEIGHGTHDGTLYRKLQIVRADAYDPDPRVECSHGVHFFLSKEEAEDYA